MLMLLALAGCGAKQMDYDAKIGRASRRERV